MSSGNSVGNSQTQNTAADRIIQRKGLLLGDKETHIDQVTEKRLCKVQGDSGSQRQVFP